jgi:hypothetical protein
MFKSSPFASAFGGGGFPGGARLGGFGGKPGEALKSGKPARPFGAPESDAEDEEEEGEGKEGSADESNAGGEEGAEEDDEGRETSKDGEGEGGREEGKASDERKKPRLQKSKHIIPCRLLSDRVVFRVTRMLTDNPHQQSSLTTAKDRKSRSSRCAPRCTSWRRASGGRSAAEACSR